MFSFATLAKTDAKGLNELETLLQNVIEGTKDLVDIVSRTDCSSEIKQAANVTAQELLTFMTLWLSLYEVSTLMQDGIHNA